MPFTSNTQTSLSPPSGGVPERRYSSEHFRPAPSPPDMTRKTSDSSITSHKSEPAWMTSMNGVDRSRAASVPERSSGKHSGSFIKLFGKKKEKKDVDQVVLTSKHTSAVRSKLAHDPRHKTARRESAPVQTAALQGSHNSMHLTAGQQEMRHPHSGAPALRAPKDKMGMPVLTRIQSGDEADEPDEWERNREEWRQRKIPSLEYNIVEGVAVDGPAHGDNEVKRPSLELVDGVGKLSLAGMRGNEFEPRSSRTHTPIGGRWKKDEKGTWKR